MLSMVNTMIKKFRINIQQIISNSDNTIDDIMNEAVVVILEHEQDIKNNTNIFINELRKRCLKFNKYGKRIEHKDRWELFNKREEKSQYDYNNPMNINEDLICEIESVKQIISKEDYDFLIFYYTYGGKETSKKYNLTEKYTMNKASSLVNKIKVNIGG